MKCCMGAFDGGANSSQAGLRASKEARSLTILMDTIIRCGRKRDLIGSASSHAREENLKVKLRHHRIHANASEPIRVRSLEINASFGRYGRVKLALFEDP